MRNALTSNIQICRFCCAQANLSSSRSRNALLASRQLLQLPPSSPDFPHRALSHSPEYSWIAFYSTDSSPSTFQSYSSDNARYKWRKYETRSAVFVRQFSTSPRWLDDESSKLDQTKEYLKRKEKELKEEQAAKNETAIASQNENQIVEVEEKPSLKERVVSEIKHYYNGFKLFFIECRISFRLLRKVLNGDSLSRRETKQFKRTVADIFRLVPFTIFIIVPFMELLLPVAVKLFPNMLPSTFQGSEKESEKKKRLKVKLELTKFLQDTVSEMGLKVGSSSSKTARKFSEFVSAVQSGDVQLSNEEILKFSKAFEDTLTLDNLNRNQLAALCKIIQVNPIGPSNVLLFQIKLHMRRIHADDVMIRKEGIASLELQELQNVVRERGMRAYGVSRERLEQQLQEWLELHLDHEVPSSLLLLSRTLYLPDEVSPTDKLKATIYALDKKTQDSIEYRIAELAGEADNTLRLDKIRREEEFIASEEEERSRQEKLEAAKAEREEKISRELEMQAREAEKILAEEVDASKAPPFVVHAPEAIVDKTLADRNLAMKEEKADVEQVEPKPDGEAKLDPEIVTRIEEALHDLAEEKTNVSEEKDDLIQLKEDIIKYNESLQEALKTGEDLQTKLGVSRGSKLLSRYLQYSIRRLEPRLEKIEAEKQKAQEKLEALIEKKSEVECEEKIEKIDEKIKRHEGTVASIEEVVSAIQKLQEVPDEKMTLELARILDANKDGIIEVDEVIKALEFISKEVSAGISTKEIRDMIVVLSKEKELEKFEEEEAEKSESNIPQNERK